MVLLSAILTSQTSLKGANMSSLTPIEVPSDALQTEGATSETVDCRTVATLSREKRLTKINSILETYNVTPWVDSNLGIAEKGQCEIMDVVDVQDITEERRVRLTLRVRLPTGIYADIKVNFGGKLMYVVPYIQLPDPRHDDPINEVYMVKRWRIETGNWSYELPHGLVFDDGKDFSDPFDSPAHEILSRTFGAKAVNSLSAAQVMPLGELTLKGENSRAETCVLAASILFPFERRIGDCEIVRMELQQTISLIEEGEKITDVNTIATLLRASKKFAR